MTTGYALLRRCSGFYSGLYSGLRIGLFSSLAPVLFLSLLTVSPAQAGPFDQGSTNVSVLLGSGRAFSENYIILGGGIGYYVIDGLELGVDAQRWVSGDPAITRVSPQIKYVLPLNTRLQPYVGAFYRRTFVDSKFIGNQNSYGARAGAYFSSRSGVYLGAGVVYEKYQNCGFGDCSNTYPELLISVSL